MHCQSLGTKNGHVLQAQPNDRDTHEWWHHGPVTLGHSHITSYKEFTERIMDRFDRRDPEIHFKDLAQLRQIGTQEAFITKFQRVAVAVTDISEPRLVMIFTEGLTQPLRGWVKAYMHHTLQDIILRTRYLADSVPKTKTFSKPFVPQKDRDRKQFQREWKDKEKLDDETRRELMRKKLCFTWKNPWVPTTGAWARERSIIVRWQKTVWTVMKRNRTVDPLAQRRSHHRRRSTLHGDHRHR
jgi:hypothetical protein